MAFLARAHSNPRISPEGRVPPPSEKRKTYKENIVGGPTNRTTGAVLDLLRPDSTYNPHPREQDDVVANDDGSPFNGSPDLTDKGLTPMVYYFDQLLRDSYKKKKDGDGDDTSSGRESWSGPEPKQGKYHTSEDDVELSSHDEKLYHSYMCLQTIRRSRLLLVYTSLASFLVCFLMNIAIWIWLHQSPLVTLLEDGFPALKYMYALCLVGLVVRCTPFPTEVDNTSTVLIHSVPYYIVALLACVDGHVDHMVFLVSAVCSYI